MDRNQWADVAIGGIAGGIQGWTQGKLQENEAARIEKETARREGLIKAKEERTRRWGQEDAKTATDYDFKKKMEIEQFKIDNATPDKSANEKDYDQNVRLFGEAKAKEMHLAKFTGKTSKAATKKMEADIKTVSEAKEYFESSAIGGDFVEWYKRDRPLEYNNLHPDIKKQLNVKPPITQEEADAEAHEAAEAKKKFNFSDKEFGGISQEEWEKAESARIMAEGTTPVSATAVKEPAKKGDKTKEDLFNTVNAKISGGKAGTTTSKPTPSISIPGSAEAKVLEPQPYQFPSNTGPETPVADSPSFIDKMVKRGAEFAKDNPIKLPAKEEATVEPQPTKGAGQIKTGVLLDTVEKAIKGVVSFATRNVSDTEEHTRFQAFKRIFPRKEGEESYIYDATINNMYDMIKELAKTMPKLKGEGDAEHLQRLIWELQRENEMFGAR